MISRQQIKEWVDSPVTLTLRNLCAEELEDSVSDPVSGFLKSTPQLTHENLVRRKSKEDEWERFAALLTGDWSSLDHIDSFHKRVEDADSNEE